MCRAGLVGNEAINFINETEEKVLILVLAARIYNVLVIPTGCWRLPLCSPAFREQFADLAAGIHYQKKYQVLKLVKSKSLMQLCTVHVTHTVGHKIRKAQNVPAFIANIPSEFQTLVTDMESDQGKFRNCKHQL